LDHDGKYILAAYEASIKEGETGGHEHNKAAAQQHEPGIASVKMKHKNSFR
jgi:hypothetical protein